jgi:hypothetical protein
MLPSGLNFHAAEPVLDQLRVALADFNPTQDYLLPIGDPLVMVVAAAIVARRNRFFKLLKWDRFTRSYLEQTVEL